MEKGKARSINVFQLYVDFSHQLFAAPTAVWEIPMMPESG